MSLSHKKEAVCSLRQASGMQRGALKSVGSHFLSFTLHVYLLSDLPY